MAMDDEELQRTLTAAVEHHRAGRLAEAKALYNTVLRDFPRHPDVRHLLGLIAYREGANEAALELISDAIYLDGSNPDFFLNLGLVYQSMNRRHEALAAHQRAAALRPDDPVAHFNIGNVYSSLGDFAQAIRCFDRALAIKPDYAEVHFNLGNALTAAGNLGGALAAYRRAAALRPDLADAHQNLGNTLSRLGRLQEAIPCYERALQIRPDFAEARRCLAAACFNIGNALGKNGRRGLEQAIGWYERAVALEPPDLLYKVYCNLGNALLALERPEQARECFEQVLFLQPESAEIYCNLGAALLQLGRVDEALVYYDKAVLLMPDYAAAHSARLFALLCRDGNDPDEIFAAHRGFALHFEADLERERRPHTNGRDPQRRLRIGYVSGDLRLHSVALFLEPLLDHHDRRQVELYAYYNRDIEDPITDRIRVGMDHWVSCRGLSDEALAERIREDGIDILVDLAGHTGDNRLLVFARKPAPVQVTYLGYPTTTGLAAMDYRLTTADVDPEGSERWYTESLTRLPRTLWCYRSPLGGPAFPGETPALNRGYVTFGSMNNVAKVSLETVGVWSAILREAAGSRLVMTSVPEGSARDLLRERFAAHGVGPERLELHGRLPAQEFMALPAGIDITLDPFPYNGTTTTCEALWRGLPVVSVEGRTSVSRSGYALLKTVGLEELCGKDEAHYVDIAVRLAKDLPRLNGLRQGMRQRLEASPLRDEAGFARDVETAYRAMWRQWCES